MKRVYFSSAIKVSKSLYTIYLNRTEIKKKNKNYDKMNITFFIYFHQDDGRAFIETIALG